MPKKTRKKYHRLDASRVVKRGGEGEEGEVEGEGEGEGEGGRKTRRTRKTRKHKFKKLLCNPAKKNHIGSSCYSSSELAMIKSAYNKHHLTNRKKQIHTTDPHRILNEVRKKNAHCGNELCWLNSLSDSELREKIRGHAFRPLQPTEWRNKPNAWLSNYDIDAVIRQYEAAYPDFVFLGPTPIDFDKVRDDGKCVTQEICGLSLSKMWDKGKRKIGVVYNLDTSDGPGTHWVSMFIDMGDPEPFLFYFNSTAEPMPDEVRILINRIQEQWIALSKRNLKDKHSATKKMIEYTNDDKVEHQHSNTECGMYSLFFIITCLTRKVGGFESLGSHLTREKLLKLFAGEKRIPDEHMLKFRQLYFVSV